MKMKAILLVVTAAAAFAQGPMMGRGGPAGPGAWGSQTAQPKFDELKAYLGLQDAQITQIQQIQKQAMESARTVMTQIQDKEKALRDLLTKGTTDAAGVGKLVLEIDTLRKQLQKSRDTAHQAAVAVLFADQKTKLSALEAAAKLAPAIAQAHALALLTPPAEGQGGFGPGAGMGLGMGPGMGRMMMRGGAAFRGQ